MLGMIQRSLKVGLLFWLLFGLSPAGAVTSTVYTCTDDHGRMSFQDRPCIFTNSKPVVESEEQASEAPAQGKHFVWQAKIGPSKVYLMGSIHFGVPDMYPLPNEITEAFKASDALVVEANTLAMDPVRLAGIVATKAVYQDGSTLRQKVSDETWKRLSEVSQSLGLSAEMLNGNKPWFVSMTLTTLALTQLGYSESLGLDVHFLRQARGDKKIIELESVEWQLGLFDKLSLEDQVVMLEETLNQIEDAKQFFDKTLSSWKAGDLDALGKLFDEESGDDPASQRFNQLVMTDRNYTMTDSIEKLAQNGQTLFVIVGAGHFTGEEGIIALLKQKGYSISQL